LEGKTLEGGFVVWLLLVAPALVDPGLLWGLAQQLGGQHAQREQPQQPQPGALRQASIVHAGRREATTRRN
jgi:hypothetical protein